MQNIKKCAIIGCGFVGATTAFALSTSGLFSELVLIDANTEKAEGEALDLNHSIPFVRPIKIFSGGYKDLSDAALIIITAGANQKTGETRIDLVKKNISILKDIIPKIVEFNKDGILLIVSNPVDILTYAALKLSGFPENRVIGSGTVLDTARLKYLLGNHMNVDSRSVHAFIIGEHGDSELAVWSSANISGIDLNDFCKICGKCDSQTTLKRLYEDVRDSAYEVIKKKGATYYAIALAVLKIAESIVRDEHTVLPVSSLINGHYGISGICLGIPAIVGRNGIEKVLDIPLNESEQKSLFASAKAVGDVVNELF
ncbi:MAG: L-lactate dehydrogenase [Oscillospiraceae bacterium]